RSGAPVRAHRGGHGGGGGGAARADAATARDRARPAGGGDPRSQPDGGRRRRAAARYGRSLPALLRRHRRPDARHAAGGDPAHRPARPDAGTGARALAPAGARPQRGAGRARVAVGAVRSRAPRAARPPGRHLRDRRRGLGRKVGSGPMPSRLSDRLLASGLVPVDGLRAALARQAVYGGALDTALLELEAIDEGKLWGALAAATELGMPDRALCEAPQKLVKPDGSDALDLDAAWSARCRAVPVGVKDGALQILCGEPVARTAIETATAALAIPFVLVVAPEIWIAAVQQAIYGRPMGPRLVRLFARVVGAQPVRRWQAAHLAPPPVLPPEPPVEIPP